MVKRHQSVRIIAGQWRGRLLPVLQKEGLRPTKDMVRETAFNWLQQHLVGKRCLDCFAGTGALGFEAASRGAANVVLVEQEREVAHHLSQMVQEHGDQQSMQVVNQSALDYLDRATPFDVIFLDPPFALDLWQACLQKIMQQQLLNPDGMIYVEASRKLGLPELPEGCEYHKQKNSGQVSFGLVRQAP